MGFLNIHIWLLAHSGICLRKVKRENGHNIQSGVADSLQWNRKDQFVPIWWSAQVLQHVEDFQVAGELLYS